MAKSDFLMIFDKGVQNFFPKPGNLTVVQITHFNFTLVLDASFCAVGASSFVMSEAIAIFVPAYCCWEGATFLTVH